MTGSEGHGLPDHFEGSWTCAFQAKFERQKCYLSAAWSVCHRACRTARRRRRNTVTSLSWESYQRSCRDHLPTASGPGRCCHALRFSFLVLQWPFGSRHCRHAWPPAEPWRRPRFRFARPARGLELGVSWIGCHGCRRCRRLPRTRQR
jgi:hypothetical protein